MTWPGILEALTSPLYLLQRGNRKEITGVLPDELETGGGPTRSFFAVYDGHAGQEAVLAAKKILPAQLASCLRACADVKIIIGSAFRAADDTSRDVHAKFHRGFATADG